MVVDDSADARYLIRAYTEGTGVEIVAEADGAERALALLDEAAPDVVVLDARMPVIDGFEAAPMLREGRPGVRIVLLTSLVDDAVRARAREAGIDATLSKEDFGAVADVVLGLVG